MGYGFISKPVVGAVLKSSRTWGENSCDLAGGSDSAMGVASVLSGASTALSDSSSTDRMTSDSATKSSRPSTICTDRFSKNPGCGISSIFGALSCLLASSKRLHPPPAVYV